MPFKSDEILWYNNGVWGELGYAVPNFGDDCFTLNSTIGKLVNLLGRNLFVIMHHSDVDQRTPPSINTLMRVHKLIVRGRDILGNRGIPFNVPNMEATHTTPAEEAFLAFPCPYFKVRNPDLKEWAHYIFTAISEAAQHVENRKEYEISIDFAGKISQYLQRVYIRMATEFLRIPLTEALKPDFTISDEQFKRYNPGEWFTSVEMTDTVPNFSNIPTEDDLKVLAEGIPANLLLNLGPWPGSKAMNIGQTSAAVSSSSFPPVPSP